MYCSGPWVGSGGWSACSPDVFSPGLWLFLLHMSWSSSAEDSSAPLHTSGVLFGKHSRLWFSSLQTLVALAAKLPALSPKLVQMAVFLLGFSFLQCPLKSAAALNHWASEMIVDSEPLSWNACCPGSGHCHFTKFVLNIFVLAWRINSVALVSSWLEVGVDLSLLFFFNKEKF